MWPRHERHGFYFVSRSRSTIVCAIPKVGCTSIKKWVAAQEGLDAGDGHAGYPDKHLNLYRQPDWADLLDRFRVLAVVRHPWDRIVSAWASKRQDSFDEFVEYLGSVDLWTADQHWRPQAWFTAGVELVRLECMHEVFPGIGWHNASRERPAARQREEVLRLYAEDLALYEASSRRCSWGAGSLA